MVGGVLAALDQLDAHPQHRYDTIKVTYFHAYTYVPHTYI